MLPAAIAGTAGDVNFSVDSISISPSSPVEGDDVQVTVTLTNDISQEITGIDVSIHPDSENNSAFHTETVSINGDGFVQVTGNWNDISFGTHSVVLVVTHNGSTNSVSKSVEVAGQIDLVASNIVLNPNSGLHTGDVIALSVDVSNTGNLDSPASHLLIQVDGTTLSELSVPSLLAGVSTTIETSFNAPAAGNHQITATANSANDGITESDVNNNAATPVSFTVLSNPDYLHHEQPNPVITVSSPVGSLDGPWTLNGQILRMGGSGESTITVGVYLVDDLQETSVTSFQLSFGDSDPLQNWQEEISLLQMTGLSPGEHTLRVRIDPSRQVPQSIQFNDDLDVLFTFHPEPNVVVSPHASSSSDTVLSGEQVSFEVTVTNTGTVSVIGDLSATFDGNTLSPILGVGIPAGEERTFTFPATASGAESTTLQFISTWTSDGASYDSNSDDNMAFGSVVLRNNLQLRFLAESESWSPADTPLVVGKSYTFTIDLVSEEGTGIETFTCLNHGEGKTLSTQELNFSSVGSQSTVICTFDAKTAGNYELYIVPGGSTVATWVASWSISATTGGGPTEDATTTSQTTTLMIIGALLLGAVLVAAYFLTQVSDEEVERETYEYCPSCDGEIEGDEEICPHCEFDLVEGLSKFHDCQKCQSNIPDILEHCPYCGEVQDVSSFFEKRERIQRVVEEMDEILEDDEDEVVLGSDQYDEAITEMGYDGDQLESEWDEHLTAAEDEIDAAIAEREKEELLSEEETEDEVVITQMRQMHEEDRQDLDDILDDKTKRRHLTDDQVKLSASDADIRADIFEITGEDGILPGQEVEVEFIPDNTVVGNELKQQKEVTDFTVVDDDSSPMLAEKVDKGESKKSESESESTSEKESKNDDEGENNGDKKRRRPVRRK